MSKARQNRLVLLLLILLPVLLFPFLSYGAEGETSESGGSIADGYTGNLFLPPVSDSAIEGAEEEAGDISHWLPMRSSDGSHTTSPGGINLIDYGFFETVNNRYKEAQHKLQERDSSIRQSLFLEGSALKQPPKIDPAEMAALWGFFEEPYEYTDGTYNVSYHKDHTNTLLIVLVFLVLAVVSFFAALGYHKWKARRRH